MPHRRNNPDSTFHAGYERSVYGAILAWFGVQLFRDGCDRPSSLGGRCTYLGSVDEATRWIEDHARADGYGEVIWDRRPS